MYTSESTKTPYAHTQLRVYSTCNGTYNPVSRQSLQHVKRAPTHSLTCSHHFHSHVRRVCEFFRFCYAVRQFTPPQCARFFFQIVCWLANIFEKTGTYSGLNTLGMCVKRDASVSFIREEATMKMSLAPRRCVGGAGQCAREPLPACGPNRMRASVKFKR